jgi:hypothetical protein
MRDKDDVLADAVRRSNSDADAPPFARVFAAAENQIRSARRKRFAGAGVAAAVILALLSLRPGEQADEFIYVDVEELSASTSWTAPSDSLLPQYQFDIYRDIPRLFESTEPDGGTLL